MHIRLGMFIANIFIMYKYVCIWCEQMNILQQSTTSNFNYNNYSIIKI